MGFGFTLLVIALMLMINAVFAAYEMALASISRSKLTALINMNKKGAKEALFMKDRMEGSLAVVQVGITLVGAVAAAVGGVGADEYWSPLFKDRFGLNDSTADLVSLVFLIIPLSCLTVVFAELVPKTYAINHQVKVCMALSPLMKSIAFITYPVINILERVVKRSMQFLDRRPSLKENLEENIGLYELRAAAALARTSRLLGAREEKIVLSAAQLSVRPLKEIIIPVTDISMIPLSSALPEALLRAHNDMHTRFPVCRQENDPRTIEGYVNFKDIIAGLKLNPEDPSVKGIMRPIKSVSAEGPISKALEQMIVERLHIAMVVDRQGEPVGMVTLEDIIEELVGEIEDEFDRMPAYISAYGESRWLMGGGVSMGAFAQTIGKAWPGLGLEEQKIRLADWFAQKVPAPLKGGEAIEADGIQVMVRKLRRKKLGEAVVTLSRPGSVFPAV